MTTRPRGPHKSERRSQAAKAAYRNRKDADALIAAYGLSRCAGGTVFWILSRNEWPWAGGEKTGDGDQTDGDIMAELYLAGLVRATEGYGQNGVLYALVEFPPAEEWRALARAYRAVAKIGGAE